jgi:hypothetical protein
MYPFEYVVSLRVKHQTIRPDEITRELGLKAEHSWSAGDKNAFSSSPRSKSYWSHRFKQPDGIGLRDFLNIIADELVAHRSFFEKVVSTQGRVEFFIGWFLENTNSGEELDWQLLQKLADLHINLSFDIYSKEQDSIANRLEG